MHDPDEIDALRTIIQWHGKKTRSWRAAQILAEWSRMQRVFWRVLPRELSVNTQTTSQQHVIMLMLTPIAQNFYINENHG